MNVILSGFMATGKSTVGNLVAQATGRRFVDLDAEIERRAGLSIPAFFSREGEAAFRKLESEVWRHVLSERDTVIATGGGTLVFEDNLASLRPDDQVICLTASVPAILSRLDGGRGRPLLTGADAAEVESLLAARKAAYDRFPQIDTTDRTAEDVAHQVIATSGAARVEILPLNRAVQSEIIFSLGAAESLGALLQARGLASQIMIVVDQTVAALEHGAAVAEACRLPGGSVSIATVPSGEQFKNAATLERLYRLCMDANLERSGTIVALGGGVVGDLAGFVAATYGRGTRLVQVPTTLLAQVDASIGGKTGIDFGGAKNLIGAFYPADLIVLDPALLETLPDQSLADGLAEILKVGFMRSAALAADLESVSEARAILYRRHIIRTAARLKIDVVRADPWETGERALLNFGHTIGHGLEAASQYTLSHGQAVAIGMLAEARLAAGLGLCSTRVPESLQQFLHRFSLPVHAASVDRDLALRFVLHDKKRVGGRIRCALPEDIGVGRVVAVSIDDVREALSSVTGETV